MRREWLRSLRPEVNGEPLKSGCTPATLAAAEAELGASATAWAIQAAASSARTTLGGLTGQDVPAGMLAPLRRVCEACILAVLRGLLRDLPPEQIEVPIEALDSVRDAVHAGVALERLLRTMWNAHVITVDLLMGDARLMNDRRIGWEEIRPISRVSFAYVDAFSERIAREYDIERGAWVGGVAAARRQVVAEVLARHPVDVAATEQTLGLRFTDVCVAIVVWSEQPEPAPEHYLPALLSAMAVAVEARSRLSVHGTPASLWAWMCVRPERPADLGARLRQAVTPLPGLRAAIGPAAAGVDGFRRSHLLAREAQRLAGLVPSWLVDHADVAVTSLLTMNAEHAGWFVEDTLGGLADGGRRTVVLQETLRVYLATGRSRAETAAMLHLAPGTVGYRVRKAEELLGRPVSGMAREIQSALEIVRARRSADAGG